MTKNSTPPSSGGKSTGGQNSGGRGPGNAGGWPSEKPGKDSGGNRSNNPPGGSKR